MNHQLVDPLLKAKEAANLLQISVPTLWRWVAAGTIPKPIKFGNSNSRWPRSDLLAAIEHAKVSREAAA